MPLNLGPNEIRDYIARAPKRWQFNGSSMVNNTGARLTWLASLCKGTLHERINRRAGIVEPWFPFKNAEYSAVRRHRRKVLKRKYGFLVNP
jgi:hypothetical protein